jgi:mRNA-degrading endonuclease RelE of RelBE toxin-antitoxin system
MNGAFAVLATPHFARLYRKLAARHSDLPSIYSQAILILESDPYNTSRRHPIRKLEGVNAGLGQYRLRLGRWRFRYDIQGREVVLHYCGLRREDTYS